MRYHCSTMPTQDDALSAIDSQPTGSAQKTRFPADLLAPAAILAVALAARSAWVAFAPSNPMDGRVFNDTVFYYTSATQLFKDGYLQPLSLVKAATASWPPGYTFFLAALFKVFHPHVSIAWGANIALGSFTCVALYYLARLLVDFRTALVAGLALALFPGHVFFSSMVLSEVTFTFLVVAALLLVALAARSHGRRAVWLLLMLGVIVGAAALVRGQGLYLLALAALYWWLEAGGWRRAARWTALSAVAALAVLTPWTIRNYVEMHHFVLISTNIGGNLYVGNFDGATGHMVFGAGDWARTRYQDLAPEDREVAVNNALLREGLKFMFSHPIREMQLTGSKIRGLFEDDEEALRGIPNHQAGETIPHADRIADVANVYYFAAIALSGIGLFLWRRRWRALLLPILAVAVFTLGELPFFTDPRFHYPMLPAFAFLAAAGVVALFDAARRILAGRRAAV